MEMEGRKRKTSMILCIFLLQIVSSEASLAEVGIWIGSGGASPQAPPGFQNFKLYSAYTALQAWKSAITSDPNGVLQSWVGTNVCSYRGIFCAEPPDMSVNLVVAVIDLNNASLRGTLVKELSLLEDLSIIHLNSNKFSGTIPDSWRDLTSLSELDLSNNMLSGPFPTVTLSLPNLIYLDLRFNQFSGSLPEELFSKEIDAIFLNNNQFLGELPMSLGYSQASVINLANNNFTGNLPASFGYTGSAIKEILFLNNQLTGCIPEGIGFLRGIEVLDFSFNSLSGHLPDSLSCLAEIEVLNLAHNQLYGVIPDILCALRNLANFTVSYNFFSGFSQDCFRLFLKNVGFDFSVNCIPGRDLQRPAPECNGIPDGINCFRIPTGTPLLCSRLQEELRVRSPHVLQHSSSSSP